MEYKHDRTYNEPYVHVFIDKNIFKISGNSYSKNIKTIFGEVLNHVQNDFSNLNGKLACKIHLSSINSETKKIITNLVMILDGYRKQGAEIEIFWYYDEDDEDVLSVGSDLQELYNIPLQIIEK